jgi:hypothetical protein
MAQPNYFKILQIDPEAEVEVLKAAYRALSRKYHPDGSHPSPDRMKQLNDAYAVLRDPETRGRYYDEYLRWKGDISQAADSIVITPPMRYQESSGETATHPKRSYRRNRFGVMTQIGLLAICLFLLVLSGVLIPRAQGDARQVTVTSNRVEFRLQADAVETIFENNGFEFQTALDPTGRPLVQGADAKKTTTLYISHGNQAITYLSLLLSARGDLSTSDLAQQEHSLIQALDAVFADQNAISSARKWIDTQRAKLDVREQTTIEGWQISMWNDSDRQAVGVMFTPAFP